jgi:lycopene beta-cyclase
VADVVVAGGGPAGWAVADQCARRGLATVLVDPRPGRRWPTYGMWLDECALLPAGSTWVEASALAAGVSQRILARRYAVLDNDSVRAAVANPAVRVLTDRMRSHEDGLVTLASGRVLAARLVIDATGPRRQSVSQTAFGVVVSADEAAALVKPGDAVFMDWRDSDGTTFLYAVPLPGGRVLLEETSLASRPGLAVGVLRHRLLARLARRGIAPGETTERVHIPLDVPIPTRRPGIVPFGAAAALVHPATGYGVAEAFRLAPPLAEAIASDRRPDRAAWRVLWSPRARAVRLLRGRGLAMLLGLNPRQVPEFFELFFGLPAQLQRGYLSERDNVGATVRAMAAVFAAAEPPLRAAIARHALTE